jgi:hypothetical protein
MKKQPLYLFGDIVVVEVNLIGVIVKTWENRNGYEYEVYVRNYNGIGTYKENELERYRVRHKYLDYEEMQWQNG